jgi:hypothetical protein
LHLTLREEYTVRVSENRALKTVLGSKTQEYKGEVKYITQSFITFVPPLKIKDI